MAADTYYSASVISASNTARLSAPLATHRWGGGTKEDEDAFLSMQKEYWEIKKQQCTMDERRKHMAVQLARTQEAARRAIMRNDSSARGGTAQRLIDMEAELSCVLAERNSVQSRLAAKHKVALVHKGQATELKARLDAVMRDQRELVQQLGKAQAASQPSQKQPTLQEANSERALALETDAQHWSALQIAQLAFAEASQRLSQMQSQLDSLQRENAALRAQRVLHSRAQIDIILPIKTMSKTIPEGKIEEDLKPWDDSESLKGPIEVVRASGRTPEMRDLATQVNALRTELQRARQAVDEAARSQHSPSELSYAEPDELDVKNQQLRDQRHAQQATERIATELQLQLDRACVTEVHWRAEKRALERRADSHSKGEWKGKEDSTAKAAEAAAEIRYLRLEVSQLRHLQSIIAKGCKDGDPLLLSVDTAMEPSCSCRQATRHQDSLQRECGICTLNESSITHQPFDSKIPINVTTHSRPASESSLPRLSSPNLLANLREWGPHGGGLPGLELCEQCSAGHSCGSESRSLRYLWPQED